MISDVMKIKIPFGTIGEIILPKYIAIDSINGKHISEFSNTENGKIILDGGEYSILGKSI